jgi:hypothetical protein
MDVHVYVSIWVCSSMYIYSACTVPVYWYGLVSYKASHALRSFYYLLCVPIWVLVIPDSPFKSLWQIPVANQEKLGEKWQWILPKKFLFHTLQGSLKCCKILWHESDGFNAPPKEVVQRNLSPINIHRPQMGFDPRTLGPTASTITTIPPRATSYVCMYVCIYMHACMYVDLQGKCISGYAWKLWGMRRRFEKGKMPSVNREGKFCY